MDEPTGESTEKNEAKAKGGRARAEKLSQERRREIAVRAATARWREAPTRATHAGAFRIGDLKLECANLPDGRRVISEAAIMRALGRGYSGYYSQRDAAADEGSAVLPRYVAPLALKPFIDNDLLSLLSDPIAYLPPKGSGVSKGIEDKALPKICRVWIEARNANKLNAAQRRTAQKAEILSFGFAEVGIAALIDEATGFQEVRDRSALQAVLDAYLRKEFAAWAKRFPDEFYEQIYRLRNWRWKGRRMNPPQAVAGYTKDLVYARLAPHIVEELDRRNPIEGGRRKAKHHQWLTEDVGHPALAQHLHAVITLMRVCKTWDHFKHLLDIAHPKRGDTLMLPMMAEIVQDPIIEAEPAAQQLPLEPSN